MSEFGTLYCTLVKTASNEPERVALVCSKNTVAYHELLMDTDRAADMFWSFGIRKNDTVAIALRNCPEFIISYLALSKIGAVAIPINFLISKKEELKFILSHCGAKAVITQDEFLAGYRHLKKDVEGLKFLISIDSQKHCDVLDFRLLLKKAPYNPKAHNQHVLEDDVCSILYTSGTTGNPKGVILTHANLLNNVRSSMAALDLTSKDVFLCLLPMFHTFAWTATVIMPLVLGCKIVLVSHITPATPWLNTMGKEGVTVMAGIPQLFSLLSKEAKGLKKYFLQYWAFRKTRFCVSGAAPLSLNVLNHFENKLKVPLLEGYGLTEASLVVSVNRMGAKKNGSVGKPIDAVHVKVIDENHNKLGFGQEGEICIKGICVTKGYFRNGQETEKSFTSDGWFKTGDIGTMDREGYMYIRDRKKDMIINKGLKVFPAQVEAVFLKHPAIEECAVVGIPHKDCEELIYCFCVLKKDKSVSKPELMRFAKEHLDLYKRPREIKIIDILPKNALNKVLKRKLRQEYFARPNSKLAEKTPVSV
jgi:long-chain acyl-CoA synthetase